MDARIFRSIENGFRGRGQEHLGEPKVRHVDTGPASLPLKITSMRRTPAGRLILVPPEGSYLLVVAADTGGRPSLPAAFLVKDGWR